MKKIIFILILLLSFLKTEAQSSVFKIVDSLLLTGNYTKALTLLKSAPKTVLICNKIGSIYQTTENYNKAIEFYLEGLQIEPNEHLKIKLGNTYNSAGLTTNALAIFEDVFQKDSLNLLVANSLAKLYLAKNKIKKAQEMYSFLKKKDTLNPAYPYKLGKVFEKQHKKYAAGENYLESYKIDTLHLKSIYALAKFYKHLNFKDSTMLFIDKGIAIDSSNTQFIQLKANELYFSKQFKNAIIYLTKLDRLNFRSVNMFEMFGMCYYNLNEYDLAEKQFRNALKIDRKNSVILYRLGSLYYDQKNFKLAKFYLMQSIYAEKGDLDKQYYLQGIIAKEEQQLKQAVAYFDKACSYNFKNNKALFELALASDAYYSDKKIAYNNYKKYIERFKSKDELMTNYSNKRIAEIKKEYFLEGIILEN